MRCWRTIPVLKHIVLRKYLRFALCDDCIEFRERRRYATSDEERREIKKLERIHHLFVHEERGSYYWRRNLAIFMQEEYMSVIADGADQSTAAYDRYRQVLFKQVKDASLFDGSDSTWLSSIWLHLPQKCEAWQKCRDRVPTSSAHGLQEQSGIHSPCDFCSIGQYMQAKQKQVYARLLLLSLFSCMGSLQTGYSVVLASGSHSRRHWSTTFNLVVCQKKTHALN